MNKIAHKHWQHSLIFLYIRLQYYEMYIIYIINSILLRWKIGLTWNIKKVESTKESLTTADLR